MKKKLTALAVTSLMIANTTISALAAPGDSGFFGGVSEGIMLPKTIEQQVDVKAKKKETLLYKEMIFISGEPIEVSGTLEIERKDDVLEKQENGSFKETYTIQAASADNSTILKREVELLTYFVKYDSPYGEQIKKDSTVTDWEETVTVGGTAYVVDEEMSDFGEGRNFYSFIEDSTPGISYYNGNISYHLVYKTDDIVYAEVTVEGGSYGYDQPWSKAEKQEFMINIDKRGTEPWQMNIQVKPFMNSTKDVYYESNNVSAISFAGTYTQVIDTEGGLTYEIKTNHPNLKESQLKGATYLKPINDFEKLKIPGQSTYISPSHYAYSDVMKLMSVGVIDETPLSYQPYEAITRGEFTVMLSKTLGIYPPKDTKNLYDDEVIVFADVPQEHDLYEWLYAAKESKLVQGRENNFFKPDEPLTREEAFALLIRVIGLDHISLDLTTLTSYVDDAVISSWAKEAIYVGTELGLFTGYTDGRINPKGYISKAEAAVIVNNLIEFLNEDMVELYMKEL